MPDFITLSCPSCGHKLQITEDVDRFACSACGNEHIVNRSGGIVTLKPVIDSINEVKVGVDKTASELAIVRLDAEINELEGRISSINSARGSGGCVMRIIAWILMLLGVIFIISLIGIMIEEIQWGSPELGTEIVQLIGSIVLFIVGIVFFTKSKKAQREDNIVLDDKIIPLQNELQKKKNELAEHRGMVTKYK
jgi:ribosomal protein S27E